MGFCQTAARLSVKRSQSKLWVTRQYRDPYVQKRLSDPAAYRSRSAFKLMEIDERYDGFLTEKDVNIVVDLGAAPGGWSQVVAGKFGWISDTVPRLSEGLAEKKSPNPENSETLWSDVTLPKAPKFRRKGTSLPLDGFDPLNIDNVDLNPRSARGTIIAVDLLNILPIPGVQTVMGDFLTEGTEQIIRGLLFKANSRIPKADVILSDMAANTSGNEAHDSQSSLDICEAVFDFAAQNLRTAINAGRPKAGVLL
jgi:23S rRNA (uridine2552-2'-O)-methyltransferase